MRKSFLVYIMLPLPCCSQLIDELPKDENGKLSISEIVTVDSTTKNELYVRSKQFFVDYFKSANDIIQLDDKDEAIVIGKGASKIPDLLILYSIRIQSKEGRYKYEIYDVSFQFSSTIANYTSINSAEWMFDKARYYKKNGEVSKTLERHKNETMNIFNDLVRAIKLTMNVNNGRSKLNNDW